jgi:beta-phosphoglucomutase-like phosphatase (HAD superfamily)
MGVLARRPRAAIFDMDGLMLDTEPLAARAWAEAAASLGVPFDAQLCARMIGRNFADCAAMARAHYPHDYPVDALLASWHSAYDGIVARDGLSLKAGVFELLDWLGGLSIPCAVATSTRRDRALSKLSHTGLLPRFAALVGGDEIEHGKPAPDIYLEAARRIAALPEMCVVLEDSEPGVRGALAAGMTPIMVPDLQQPSHELRTAAPWIDASLHDVIARLARLPA